MFAAQAKAVEAVRGKHAGRVKYNPDQPRVPAGSPDGGEFGAGGGREGGAGADESPRQMTAEEKMRHPDAEKMAARMKEIEDKKVAQRSAKIDKRIDEICAEVDALHERTAPFRAAHPTMSDRPAEYHELRAEMDRLADEAGKLAGERAVLKDKARAAALKEVIGNNKPLNLNVVKVNPPAGVKEMNKGVEAFKKMAGGGGIVYYPDVTLKGIGEGEGYNGNDNRSYAHDAEIHMAPNAGAATTVHELGHVMESMEPEVHKAAIAFLDRRTAGESARPLKEIVPGSGYRDDEKARPDGFLDPYVGKDYGGHATEVVSMGLEHMYRDPIAFAKADPDHFAFTYSVMHRHDGKV